ncbi:haloacid dehalogenase [Pullulanibacillus camelliae]|uniref:Haloacid dehalogenase n=1 Tax=Pullulanibacillus camelliae TaxID=1707096 RepID=A0A8J2VHG8_9BACL|nr:HAD family hydrolase [Pullulanibacillus camelliae]GGE27239.1 haloacid dehalogenase [Pullulanibacillus camelliae]
MIDSILFDLDGTLWDSTEACSKIWSEVAAKYNVNKGVAADELKKLFGLPTECIAKRLFHSLSETTALEIMNESCEKQCPYLETNGGILFPHLMETLMDLKERYRLFIVSNCQEGYIQAFIKGHHLEGYFEDYEYPGRTGLSKADNIRLVVERNHLRNPIYVGDTLGDKEAAEKAELPFVYAKYGFGELKAYDYAVDSLRDLNQWLRAVNEF